MKKFAIVVLIAVAFVAGFGYGRWYGKPARVAAGAAPRKILYWQDPMHPQYKSDKPGIAPDCGMKLVPIYADAPPADSADRRHSRPVDYADVYGMDRSNLHY